MALILGKSMVQWVCELAAAAVGRTNVFVATDSDVIQGHVSKLGFQSVMTDENCKTGTDRVADAMRILGADYGINVQGDEPMVSPSLILQAADELRNNRGAVVNFYSSLGHEEDPDSQTIPKVVLDENGRLLYASRAAIPASKNHLDKPKVGYRKQVCVYGYHLSNLTGFGNGADKTNLENIEDIEILRFVELGIPVQFFETHNPSLAVDVPIDIERVEKAMSELGISS